MHNIAPLPEQTAIVRFLEYAEQRIRVFFDLENAHPFDGDTGARVEG